MLFAIAITTSALALGIALIYVARMLPWRATRKAIRALPEVQDRYPTYTR